MLSVYIGSPLPRYRHLDFLYPNLGVAEPVSPFGEATPFFAVGPVVSTAATIREADAFLLPYPYLTMKEREGAYLEEFFSRAVANRKPVIVAALGDTVADVDSRADVVLRTSAYRSALSSRDIIVPPSVVDLGTLYGVSPRDKAEQPVVGFCGYAGFQNVAERIRFSLKDSIAGARAVFSERAAVARSGIHYRQAAMKVLSRSPGIKTQFVVRPFFSGNKKTLGMDATAARREYVENMRQSDLVLSPRGGGNFSLRFFEALSLGRVPLLIDTDLPLPGGDDLYEGAILRASWRDVRHLGDVVAKWHAGISDASYRDMQARARAIFETRLYAPAFYRQLFDELERTLRALKGVAV